MFTASILGVQARRALSFATSLCIRWCSLQFHKTCAVHNSTCFSREDIVASLGKLRQGHSRFTSREIGNESCHQKRKYTSIAENDNISKEKKERASDFSSSFSDDGESIPRVKVGSAVVNYTLNENGFMDIEDLVDFLKRENAIDICVIRTRGDKRSYVDYFVVVSGVSTRHLRAMAKNLEQLFRGHEVRGIGRDGCVVVEGLESDHWVALDIGNIVVHLFLPEVRDVYELEKLWTLGPKYDDQSKAMLEKEKFLRAAELGTIVDNNTNVTEG